VGTIIGLSVMALSMWLVGFPSDAVAAEADLQHFIFFDLDRHRIHEASFLQTDAIAGAQLKYTWRELEPERDRYALESVLADLGFLESRGKRLFVQLQDVSFDERLNVPDYLLTAEFHGGAARKYERGDDDSSPPQFDGWVARRWDPVVIDRMAKLFAALGAELDGKIEGVSLPETDIGFGGRPPEDFTPENYAEAIKSIVRAAREAFPRSHVILYANFMPGEELPNDDRGFLRGIYEYAEQIGVGGRGPDFRPTRWFQRQNSLKFIAARDPGVVAGLAVQRGNLADVHPRTGEKVTATELYRYACDPLHLDYIFWGTQEPYYAEEVLPLLRELSAGRGR